MDTASTTPSSVTPSADVSSGAPMIAPVIPDTSKPAKKSWSSVIAIVLILIAIVVGAFYAWGQRIAQMQPATTATAY